MDLQGSDFTTVSSCRCPASAQIKKIKVYCCAVSTYPWPVAVDSVVGHLQNHGWPSEWPLCVPPAVVLQLQCLCEDFWATSSDRIIRNGEKGSGRSLLWGIKRTSGMFSKRNTKCEGMRALSCNMKEEYKAMDLWNGGVRTEDVRMIMWVRVHNVFVIA
jgi:hypothetical protein